MDVVRDLEFPELPRLGIRMFLPKEMNQVECFGMGPWEIYIDKHRASSHAVYQSMVSDLHEDYIKPQENGSHWDCDYVKLYGDTVRLAVTGDESFCFNASVFSQEELTAKAHNYELIPCGSTVLCVDCAHYGIGSNSCGPAPQDKYELNKEHYHFRIKLLPKAKMEKVI